MKKPKTSFCFRIWDKLVHKWCASGYGSHSKDGKIYSSPGHARSAITNKVSGRNNPRDKKEFELRFYKMVEITETEYNKIRAEEHERKNS